MDDPSLHDPQETGEELKQEQAKRRLCDYCNYRAAVLYCRADSAKLCFSCDREVHSTNQLFSKHSRSQLCDGCDASPASIFCETEQYVLCTNCDWENHSQGNLYLSPLHNRRPIESFTGCPSVSELLAIIGLDDLDHEVLFVNDENGNDSSINGVDGDELSAFFAWETRDFVSIDDLIISSDSGHNFHALGVPSLPKNRNAACGQHKEEMLCQLRQLANFEPNMKYEIPDFEPVVRFQSLEPEPNFRPANLHTGSNYDTKPIAISSYEAKAFKCFGDHGEAANQLPSMFLRNHIEESSVAPNRYLDFGGRQNNVSGDKGQSQHPNVNTSETLSFLPKVGVVHELNSQERDSAISRYKEKRKTRRYDKHIRYESRKVRAESRTRIKGRFAKIDH